MLLLRNPLARKRWQRFKRRRRAYVSLLALLFLGVVGALANVLCNEKPLYVRLDGKHYVPFLKRYTDTTFTGSGLLTRPDYRALADTPRFADSDANIIVFAPVPYGPRESLDPAELMQEETVTVRLTPKPYVGSISVVSDLTVIRATAAGYFFGGEDAEVRGKTLDGAWRVTAGLRRALDARFANRESAPFETMLSGRADPAARITVKLPRFRPRRAAPPYVRLRLVAPLAADAEPREIVFGRDGQPQRGGDVPARLGEDARAAISEQVRMQLETGVSAPASIAIDGTRYRAEALANVVRWPYRPVRGHWMGIDAAGHDVLARILYGLRIALSFGLLLAAAAMVIGSIIGAIQGYFGGATDLTGQRLIEIWSALPFLYIMILMGSVFGRSFGLLLFVYGLFNWIGTSYYIRAEFLRLRHEPFVESAKCLGVPAWKIMYRHVMPNALTPLITLFPFLLVGAIGALAALDFLGFGLPPLTPSWGELLRQAQAHLGAWWLIVYPALALFAVMLLCVFIGEGVRDAYDPRPLTKLE